MLKVNVILGKTSFTEYMIKKLQEDYENILIVMDYNHLDETEPIIENGALYCSPNQAKTYIEIAGEVSFHRYGYVKPRLNN
ncbi:MULTISPECIES: hypothetical protein [Psychrobacillus]|uniref:Uncharacterized protein n=1 Tax=Psychrobacillus faecigallinarum TaxID=2762235 RepID=A0ABR8R5W9_9BACI|nr:MULTISPECIES: hypothetical protein [Psychrobacillus]MBD7943174.1 hypothetical protein [Psychrobacillus faecigallinarum]QEY20618.1 hypothetical protein D0S48_07835 [Psychrobacillus sp. AK 1817]QGM31156.1 hypothetical protein GI482_12495 [Bacillus sp. N3536]